MNRLWKCIGLSCILGVTFCPLPLLAQQFQILGSLYPEVGDQSNSHAHFVSGDGSVVVGQATSFIEGRGTVWQAFRWTPQTGMEGLGFWSTTGNWVESAAHAVSYDGQTVVGGSVTESGSWRSFRWTANEGMTAFTDSPFSADGISGNGSVILGSSLGGQASYWTSANGIIGLGSLPGANFSDGRALAASHDGSVIIGETPNSSSTSGSNYEAFLWTAAQGMVGLGSLANQGTINSAALAISSDGSTVVGSSNSALGYQAFLWTADEGMIGLGDLAGGPFSSMATGVSGDGSIVIGNSRSAASGNFAEPFLWTKADGMQSLTEILLSRGVDLQGWQLVSAEAISADGTVIVGNARKMLDNDQIFQAYRISLTAIPEPSSAALLLILGLSSSMIRRRRRRGARPVRLQAS